MTIWDKVKEGIDKAGKVASEAIDDGKTRIEAYRAREQADKAAEAFGYAVFRASELRREMDAESRDRLMQSLRVRDTEARRLESLLVEPNNARPAATSPAAAAADAAHADTSAADAAGAAATAAAAAAATAAAADAAPVPPQPQSDMSQPRPDVWSPS